CARWRDAAVVGDMGVLCGDGCELWRRHGSPLGLTPPGDSGAARARIDVAKRGRVWTGTAHQSPHAESDAVDSGRRTVGLLTPGPVTRPGQGRPAQRGYRLRHAHCGALSGRCAGKRSPHGPATRTAPGYIIARYARVIWEWASRVSPCSIFLAGHGMC